MTLDFRASQISTMSNNGPALSRGSNAAVDCCRHSSLKRMISDKTMMVYARAAIDFRTLAQYGSHDGNILQYMEHALYQMDMLKSAFRKYRINTGDKDESENFTFSKFYAIAHYSLACMEPTTGDESCIQMDRQGAFCHFPRIKSMPISKSRLSGIQHARQMQWQWRSRSYMAKRNQSRLLLMTS